MIAAKRAGLLGFAVAALTCGSIHAADVDMTFNNVDPGQSVTFYRPGASSSQTTSAGIFNWTQNGADLGPFTAGQQFDAFCIEVTQVISSGQNFQYQTMDLKDAPVPGVGVVTWGSGTGMGSYRANLITHLFHLRYQQLQDDLASNAFTLAQKKEKAAAFQLAIWEIVYDHSLTGPEPDLTLTANSSSANDFYLSSTSGTLGTASLRNAANALLVGLDKDFTGGDWDVFALSYSSSYSTTKAQDMVTAIKRPTPGGGNPIPTPMSAAMGILGFMMVGLRRQRTVLE